MDEQTAQGLSIEERLQTVTTQPAEEKQPSPMPSEEKPAEVVQETPQENHELKTEDEEQVALENSKNPERTKAYIEKLKAQLKEKETPKQDYSSVFDVPVDQQVIPNLNPQQVNAITNQYIDENGNVDVSGLNKALQEANDRAFLATQEVENIRMRVTKWEENQQAREAHAVYPEIDPTKKETFDPGFYEMVRDRIIRNRVTGKQQTLLEAASDIAKYYKPSQKEEVVKKEAVEQYRKAQEARQQGPLEVGRGQQRTQGPDLSELRERTRHGDDDAFFERLNAVIGSK